LIKNVGADHERYRRHSGQGRKDGLEVPFRARLEDLELKAEPLNRWLHVSRQSISQCAIGRVDKQGNGGCARHQFVQQLQLLCIHFHAQVGHACEVASRPVQAGDKSNGHGVEPSLEHDRNRRGCRLGRKCSGGAARGDHGHPAADQLGRQRRQSSGFILRPTIFDCDVLAFDVARLP
jgi:hypothetical protein